jgi:hypothetical protein
MANATLGEKVQEESSNGINYSVTPELLNS